jgi:hypothetical protein
MLELLPFLLFGLAFVGLVVWLTLKDRAAGAARRRKLAELGFVPCPERAGFLAETVAQLENNSEYRYSVEDPMQAPLGEQTAHHYSKSRSRSGQIVVADELLFPLKRSSSAGVVVFVKPTSVPAGTATKLIGAVATGGWDSQPDDLKKLDLPVDLQNTNVIAALGPPQSSLYDLLDASILSVIQQVGDCGALLVMCRGERCSLASTSQRMPLDVAKLWSLIGSLR